jgi:hypothetical protein
LCVLAVLHPRNRDGVRISLRALHDPRRGTTLHPRNRDGVRISGTRPAADGASRPWPPSEEESPKLRRNWYSE